MVHVTIAVIAFAIPPLFESAIKIFCLPQMLAVPISFGAVFTALYFAFDRFLWKLKLASSLIGVPNLNGQWIAEGVSSYIDPETNEPFHYRMIVTIKQTFSKIEIFTETKDSTSRSTMASLSTQHAKMFFRYAFENTPKNKSDPELQRHPGLIELRINSPDEMVGDYFSGKHRLRYGELTLKRSAL